MRTTTKARPKVKARGLDLSEVDTGLLFCRRGMTGHRWDWDGLYLLVVAVQRSRLTYGERTETCLRCGATKTQTFKLPTMDPIGSARMRYQPGYLLNHKVTSAEVRRTHWERTR